MARLVLAALLLASVSAINVLEVEDDMLDSVVDGRNSVLLMFYTPGNYMCDQLKTALAEAAAKYTEHDALLFGQVNGAKEKAISARYGVKGHPTFKWFDQGSDAQKPFYFVHYTGGYEETLEKMINERLHKRDHSEL